MSSPFLPESAEFKKLNFIEIVAFNIATAIWGANTCNSSLYAFGSTHSFRMKLMLAWVWTLTTVSQGLTTTEFKVNYVLWGFIKPDSAIRLSPLSNVINLMAGFVAASFQGFFIYEIFRNSRKSHLIPIFSALPILLLIVIPLTSIISPSASLLDFYRKDLLMATLFSEALLNTCIFAGLSRILAPRYLFLRGRKYSFFSSVLRFILFSLNSGFWTVLVSISKIAMLYFLYSYSSLFVLYSHLNTAVYFMTLLSFLSPVNVTDEDPNLIVHFNSSAARARMVRNANSRSMVVDGEELYFKHPSSINGTSLYGH